MKTIETPEGPAFDLPGFCNWYRLAIGIAYQMIRDGRLKASPGNRITVAEGQRWFESLTDHEIKKYRLKRREQESNA